VLESKRSRVAESLMSEVCRRSCQEEGRLWHQCMTDAEGVQTSHTSIVKKRDPHGGILDKKMKLMKLKKDRIISCKPVHI
jgi:hypothetical protein